MITKTRVLLVDDHTLFRQAIREVLETDTSIEVVAEAGDSASAVRMAGTTQPDVILLDVELDGTDTSDTLARLRRAAPQAKVVILTMYDNPLLIRRLLGQGARGYLLKTITREDLIQAVHSTQRDQGWMLVSASQDSLRRLAAGRPEGLSTRECDVLALAANALTNAQIAKRLSITEGTVKRHLRNIFVKLDAVSRVDAVNKGIAASLITAPRGGFDRPRPPELTGTAS
jgi:DNA-binding NarL/FixJ family response regulator